MGEIETSLDLLNERQILKTNFKILHNNPRNVKILSIGTKENGVDCKTNFSHQHHRFHKKSKITCVNCNIEEVENRVCGMMRFYDKL